MICGFIDECSKYVELTDAKLRKLLEESSKESPDLTTIENLDKIVSQKLRTDMRNTNAKSRMQDLFSSYVTIISRNGLVWLIDDNAQVAVHQVLSVVRLQSCRTASSPT